MKKLWLVFIAICLMLLSACSDDSSKEKNSKEEETVVEEQVPEEETVNEVENTDVTEEKDTAEESEDTTVSSEVTEQISVGVGLGDTTEAFENEYGENNGDSFMARFQDDYILPLLADGRAMNIKLQFEATNEPSRTLEDAKIVAQSFIPKDAKFIKEYSDDALPRVVMEYQSDSIAKLYPEIVPIGTFIVIFNHGEGNPNDVFGITIGVGNNP